MKPFEEQVAEYTSFTARKREERLRALSRYAVPGRILFLGDSLTEEFPAADLLWEYPVVCRGCSGDTAERLKDRLPYTCYPYRPKAAFVQVGTNDLGEGVGEEEAARRVLAACAEVEAHCPGARVYAISLYPVNLTAERFRESVTFGVVRRRTNAQICRVNALLAERCANFIDVFGMLTDERGGLKESYSCDGLHLTVEGYAAVVKGLIPYLEKIVHTEA